MSLQDKLEAWAKSSKGKAKIAEARKSALKTGKAFGSRKGSGGAGTGGASRSDIEFYKKEFLKILREKIQDAGYDFAAPGNINVTGLFNDTTGYYELHFNFDQESIQRESLCPEKYPDGAYDIVALLNHGYDANGQVYGYWEPAGRVIGSLQSREGLFYIQAATETFEQLYGDTVRVSYNEKYDKRS